MRCLNVPGPLSNLPHESLDTRRKYVYTLDAAFLQWFVGRHSKKQFLCIYCTSKGSVVNVHERYRSHVKNVGKSKFDICGTEESRAAFVHWLISNDIDAYIKTNANKLHEDFDKFKLQLYAKYKANAAAATALGKHSTQETINSNACRRKKNKI